MYIAFYGKKANVKMIDPKSDESWYKYVSVSKQTFISNGIQEDELYEHIVAHALEELITQDKLIILNNIFNDIDYKELIEKFNYDDIKIFENDIKGYFQKSLFEYQGNKFILLFNDSTDDNVSLFILDEANKLIEQPNEMFKTLLKKGEFAVNFSKKYSCSNIACSNINMQYGVKKINKGSQKIHLKHLISWKVLEVKIVQIKLFIKREKKLKLQLKILIILLKIKILTHNMVCVLYMK